MIASPVVDLGCGADPVVLAASPPALEVDDSVLNGATEHAESASRAASGSQRITRQA